MSVSSRQKALTTNSRRLSSLAASPDFKYQPSGHDIFSSASAAGPERLLPRVLKSDRRTSAVTGLFSWSQHSVHLLSACNTLVCNSTVKPSHTHTNNRGSSGILLRGPRLHQGKGAARHSTGRHTSHLAFTSGVLHDTFLPGARAFCRGQLDPELGREQGGVRKMRGRELRVEAHVALAE